MAIELIERRLCDGHLIALEEEVIGFTTEPMKINGKLLVMELCNDCEATMPVATFMKYLAEYGRDPNKVISKKSKSQVEAELKEPCSFCPRKLKSNQARLMHERRSHPDEFAAREAEQAEEARNNEGEEGAYDPSYADVIVPDNPGVVLTSTEVYKGRRGACVVDDCQHPKFKTEAGWEKHIQNQHPETWTEIESGLVPAF